MVGPRHRKPATSAVIAMLGVACCAAVLTGRAEADALPALQAETSVALPKAGQYQLCLRNTAGQHLGKCNSSPLIRNGVLTIAISYTGGRVPAISATAATDACPSGSGVVVTAREVAPGGEASARIDAPDALGADGTTTDVGPITVGEDQGFVATACLTVED